MTSLEEFMHISLYIVMFATAVTLLFVMLEITQRKQEAVLHSSKLKPSVASETFHEDGTDSYVKEKLPIKKETVFSNIQSLANSSDRNYLDRLTIGSKTYTKTAASGEQSLDEFLDKIKSGDADAIRGLNDALGTGETKQAQYKYSFKKGPDDFVISEIIYK